MDPVIAKKEVNSAYMNSNDAELHIAAHEVRILAGILTKVATRDLEQRLSALGITLSSLQHGVLQLLRRHPYTSSELSRKMMVTPATLVPAVDVLERHGLVERSHDPHDRRRTPLVLTEHGIDLLKRVPFIDEDDTLVNSLAGMGKQKREQLVCLLRELVTSLSNNAVMVDEIASGVRRMVREHADMEAALRSQGEQDKEEHTSGDATKAAPPSMDIM
jgi:DNA-binding MarR family transcriptional regulator